MPGYHEKSFPDFSNVNPRLSPIAGIPGKATVMYLGGEQPAETQYIDASTLEYATPENMSSVYPETEEKAKSALQILVQQALAEGEEK